jgi:hypothetical protein
MNFSGLVGAEIVERARQRLKELVEEHLGFIIQDISEYRSYRFPQWKDKIPALLTVLDKLVNEFRT